MRNNRQGNRKGDIMNLQTRIAIEKRIVHRVVKDALRAGYSVSVFDGEEFTLNHSTDSKTILAALMTTDEDTIRLHDKDGNYQGAVFFVYGNDGYDVIADYSVALEEFLTGANEYAEKQCELYA